MESELREYMLNVLSNFINKVRESINNIVDSIKKNLFSIKDIQNKIDIHNYTYGLFRNRYTRSLGNKSQIYNCRPRIIYCRNNL